MKLKLTLILAVAFAFAALPAWAGTLNFNFGACPPDGATTACQNTNIGHTATYTSGGFSITATGFDLPSGNADLFAKFNGPGSDETGLGIAGALQDEITTGNFIQLDLASLSAAGITSGMLTITSVQSGEGYKICQSALAGTLGSCSSVGILDNTPFTVDWTSADSFLSVTAGVPTDGTPLSNVLLTDLTATSPVPEPASMVLFGTMLVAFAFMYRRFNASRES